MSEGLFPYGRWVVARTDNKFLFLSSFSPGAASPSPPPSALVSPFENRTRWVLGRDPQLPAEQQLPHLTYISREHLVLYEIPEKPKEENRAFSAASGYIGGPPRLRVYHVGKNPSFWGSNCDRLPSCWKGSPPDAVHDSETAATAVGSPRSNNNNDDHVGISALEFVVDASVSSPTREEAGCQQVIESEEEGNIPWMRIKIPPMSFTKIIKFGQIGWGTEDRDDATLYFPDGLQLPDLHIAFESMTPPPLFSYVACDEREKLSSGAGSSAATSTLSVAQMLAVRNVHLGDLEEDED